MRFVSPSEIAGVRPAKPTADAIQINSVDHLSADLRTALSADIGRHEDVRRLNGLLVGRDGGEAMFAFDQEARSLQIAFTETVVESRRTQILLDWVVPYVLADLGHLVLHATAVDIDGFAWAFCGKSGLGKSTLAVSFALAGRSLVADDTFVLDRDRQSVLPSHPTARLLNDSMRAIADEHEPPSPQKTVLGERDLPFAESPLRLGGIFMLQPPGPFEIEKAAAFDVATLLEQTYVLPGDGLSNGLDEIVALIDRDVVHTLTYRRDFSELDDVLTAIERFAHAKSEGSL